VQSVSRTFSLPWRGRQVIEADLNCSELRRLGARRLGMRATDAIGANSLGAND
jgi:hypothetical protein